MKPKLQAVTTELPDPPHQDVKLAGAFPFDLDVNRMLASDTWALTPPEIRPWCLMAWVISWTQTPMGSLPSDEEILAVRLGCSCRMLEENRRYILRNWKLHSNGRLYHPVVSEYVTKAGRRRKGWRDGQKDRRDKIEAEKNQQHSRCVNVDSTEICGESPPSSSSSSSSSSKKKPRAAPFKASAMTLPPEINQQAWDEFCQHRSDIRKPLSKLAATKHLNVLKKYTPEQQQEVVNYSIEGGYPKLYPLKQNSRTPENQPTAARRIRL